MRAVRIGTRGSALARAQTETVLAAWRRCEPALEFEVVEVQTAGDEQPETPLEHIEETGFFSSAIEGALLEGRVDIAVHSYKDLPVVSTPGLVVAAVPPRGPSEDALCARDGAPLAGLRRRASVGTSSPRRAAQLRALRPDLDCRPVRGNVPTRLERVASGGLDAVVLALAGLERLGLHDRATEVFPSARLLPAPAQGALAVQARANDAALLVRLRGLDHLATRLAVEAERAVLHGLRGGCSAPLGAHARATDGWIIVDAGVFAPDGTRAVRVRAEGRDPAAAGADAMRRLIDGGAADLLAPGAGPARAGREVSP